MANDRQKKKKEDSAVPLVDELGVEKLDNILFGSRGRLFSAAGRQSPIAEIQDEFLMLYPPQKPFKDNNPVEDISVVVDDEGILLSELGERRRIAGAKYHGKEIYCLGETKPGTFKHLVGWLDTTGKVRKLYFNGETITVELMFKIRNRTHDGEISMFPEITTE